MIRFFRQIRQKLLAENRVSRYLLYALGEILLVVIGILIALQVNTWNEQENKRVREVIMLKGLHSDLQQTYSGLESGRALNEETLVQYRYLMDAIDANAPYSQKIDSAMAWLPMFHVPIFTRTAYESLKSQGVDLISNDSLKREIANLYEHEFLYLTEDQSRLEWSLHSPHKTDYISRYLRYKDGEKIIVYPVDFERVKSDREFVNFLSSMISVRAAGLRYYDRNMKAIQKTLHSIESELKSLTQ